MTKQRPTPLRVVIDADVACGAANKSFNHSDALACATILEAVGEVCHHAVMNDKLLQEWKEHERPYARRWRVRMKRGGKFGTNEKYIPPKPVEVIDVQQLDWDSVCASSSDPAIPKGEREHIEKDLKVIAKDRHLLEIAIATDGIIVTCEAELLAALKHFSKYNRYMREILQRIRWINPKDHGAITALETL